MKRKGRESEAKVNSLSKQGEGEAELRNSENTTFPIMSVRDEAMDDHSKPKKGDLDMIYQLMDGFKASKVMDISSINFTVKCLAHRFH